MAAATLADTGTLSGYLASFSPDHEGDHIMGVAAVADSVAAVNSGRMVWHLTNSHSDRPSDVVATVTHAAVDANGVRVEARWAPTAAAQELRSMARAGHQLGMSIDYTSDASRPNTRGGRDLARITIHGGAIVTHPMNSMCRITESKHAAPVVTVGQDIADGSARRDPDRERIRREDQLLAAVDWPPPGLFDRETSLALIRGAAAAKTLAVPADEGGAMLAARYEENNNYSNGLARWMAAHRPRR